MRVKEECLEQRAIMELKIEDEITIYNNVQSPI